MNFSSTVLMPVYNAEKYLKEAIDSILNQTFFDFEFLIINDGSTDKSEEIILSYDDKRIRYIKNDKNIGFAATLNKGIDLISSQYIFRMDADDISISNRLEIQKKFMDDHPEIGVSSTSLERFGNDNEIWHSPLYNNEIKAYLLFASSIAHAPCVFRTKILKENNIYYRDIYPPMEDYDLWLRLRKFTSFANINAILYRYRVIGNSMTAVNVISTINCKKELFKELLKELNIEATDEELLMHIGFGYKNISPTRSNLINYKKWLDKLVQSNKITNAFPQHELVKSIEARWNKLFYIMPDYGFENIWNYLKISRKITLAQLSYLLKHTINKYVLRKIN
jgi:glycosyltransferase involved in cell wall biosynthesis